MQFSQKTVLEFFDSSKKSFVIPVYQRAYSWGSSQWQTLIDDLREQIAGRNNYFFGNVLLETTKKGVQYEIIDGQQRLTTLVIFMRSLSDVLKFRQLNGERVKFDFKSLERIYFRDGGNIKLRPVEYDRACFDSLIISGKAEFNVQTPSQRNILLAKGYIYEELDSLPTSDLLKIFEKLESTELTSIELRGKKDSALMFELQNNRGKDLTNMEKLKSYFMYQMYVYSPPSETETNIEHIANVFKAIYVLINDLTSLNEDSVLIYHANSYLKKGLTYRSLDDIKDAFNRQQNKVIWINEFIESLHATFSYLKRLELSDNPHWLNIRYLGVPAYVYPFAIKGYRYFDGAGEEMDRLFHALEILVFRHKLIASRADLTSRLNEVLVNFSGDVTSMIRTLEGKTHDYWSEHEMSFALRQPMYKNAAVRYLLWRYEAKLQNKGYRIQNFTIDGEQIEHISPQTPNSGGLASGYEVDENNEYESLYGYYFLDTVGNLLLISATHNASIGNKPFREKLESYENNPLLRQQAEITHFTNGDHFWGKEAIGKRQAAIVEDFALNEWSYDHI